MKLQHTIYFLAALLCSFIAQAGETERFDIFDDALAIQVSTELNVMSKSTLKKRYGKQKVAPEFAFEDEDNGVTFTFTQYPTPASKESMNKIHKSISNMLRKSAENADWKKDKVYSRFGTKVAVYEYEISGVGKYQYNLTYVLPVNGKLAFISFINTDKKYKKKWRALARESLDSISLKESGSS